MSHYVKRPLNGGGGGDGGVGDENQKTWVSLLLLK